MVSKKRTIGQERRQEECAMMRERRTQKFFCLLLSTDKRVLSYSFRHAIGSLFRCCCSVRSTDVLITGGYNRRATILFNQVILYVLPDSPSFCDLFDGCSFFCRCMKRRHSETLSLSLSLSLSLVEASQY